MSGPYFTTAPFTERNKFGYFLNQQGLSGEAVEVGTHRGQFAGHLLDHWNGSILHCVDPWSIPEGYEEQAKQLCNSTGDRQADYKACQDHLFQHRRRVDYIVMTSLDAVSLFKKDSLDFVYVDGDHGPNQVLLDLNIWWSKLRSGGILAGHDILMPGEPDGRHAGDVQGSVLHFATSQLDRILGGAIHLVCEPNHLPWSFYMVKV